MFGNLTIKGETIGRWELPVLAVDGSTTVSFPVLGIIGNSVPTSDTGKKRLAEWKTAVAVAAKAARGPLCWESRWNYAITVGFAFHPPTHGNMACDIENFVKPCVDALAAGLFCLVDMDPRTIQKFNYDDSNFVRLFIQRLPDARNVSEEGAAFYVATNH